MTLNYERKLYDVGGVEYADPRVSHAVTLQVDEYGNVLKSVRISYGRRFPDKPGFLPSSDRRKQDQMLLTLTENDYTNPVDERERVSDSSAVRNAYV